MVGVNRYSLRPNRIRSGSKSHCSKTRKGVDFRCGGGRKEGREFCVFLPQLFSPLPRSLAGSLACKVGTNSCHLAIAQRPFGAADCQKVTPMSQLMRSRTLAGQLSEVEGEAEACTTPFAQNQACITCMFTTPLNKPMEIVRNSFAMCCECVAIVGVLCVGLRVDLRVYRYC